MTLVSNDDIVLTLILLVTNTPLDFFIFIKENSKIQDKIIHKGMFENPGFFICAIIAISQRKVKKYRIK